MLLLRILALAAAGYLGACLLVYWLQRSLVFFPVRKLGATPADVDLPFTEVTLTAADGVTLAAWWIPRGGARGTVLFCHGNAGNMGHRLDTIRCLRRLGLNVFLFDYRGYGRSTGRPDEDGLYADAEAAWRHLVETRGVPAERLVLWGRSLGAAVAAELARRRPAAALVLESAFTSVPDMARRLFPWLPVGLLCRYRFDTLGTVRRLHLPVAVVHSPEDEVVPFAMGEALYAAAAGPKRFVRIQGGHNDGFLLSGAAYLEPLGAFLAEVLPAARTVPPTGPRG